MKKLFNVIILTLAANFLALAGGVGWLYKDGRLTNENVTAIKNVLYPPPTSQPTTQPLEQATTQPSMRLEELVAKASGRTASEQVEFIRTAFDAQAALIERRRQEVLDNQLLVDHAKEKLAQDRAALEAREKALAEREQQSTKLASDKGFQDSLILYNTMPSAQVKKVFAGLDDQTIMNYLQAMEPRTASKIIKEFKSPEETERIQKILERMRLAQASTKE